jgi:hypothetical protein
MQPHVGWALLFASVTCLQVYIRWDPFVLGAQSLDMSLLSLCQHNKMFLPAKLPQCPVSQLEIPATFLGISFRLWRWWFVTYLVPRVHSLDCWEKIPPGATHSLIHSRYSSSQQVRVIALDTQQKPVRCRNKRGEGGLLVLLVRTQVRIQACLRRQKGRLTTSQRLLVTAFWG